MKTILKTFDEAIELISREAALRRASLGSETLRPPSAAMGRVSAERVVSPVSTPAEDNSAMDGFAVRSHETLRASEHDPLPLEVRGVVLAGDSPCAPAPRDLTCIEIMTGAPIPAGYDAVIKIEETTQARLDDATPAIRITRPVGRGEHVRKKGADYHPGKVLFEKGVTLGPEHALAMASVGITELGVLRKPRIALISTGSEIVDPSLQPLPAGKVRNSTGSHLVSAIPFHGAELIFARHCGDDSEEFLATLKQVLSISPDVILTTGAVSKGKKDYVPEVVLRSGAVRLFHEVAVRPGKPGFFAAYDRGPVLFGMPGNPVSTAVAMRFFVGAYLRELMGLARERPWQARLRLDVEKPGPLRCFYKARAGHAVDATESTLEVEAHSGQPSFMVSPLLESNAWVILPEGLERVARGTRLAIYPLHPGQAISPMDFDSHTPHSTENCC